MMPERFLILAFARTTALQSVDLEICRSVDL